MTTAIANDTFSFLPVLGSNLGDFMTNILPAIITVVVVLGIIGGVIAIVYAFAMLVKGAISKKHFK